VCTGGTVRCGGVPPLEMEREENVDYFVIRKFLKIKKREKDIMRGKTSA
jgi:hypothetical protein